MKNIKISLCHHPTTVIFVDDNQDYLMNLQGRFNDLLPSLTFTDPQLALKYLNETYQKLPFITRCIQSPKEDISNCFEASANIEDIYKEINNPHRFEEVAVVVVDYAMPNLNGVEFCKQIKNTNLFIILLTGEAGIDVAINAFNEGIINKYIEKGPNIKDVLYEAIKKCEKQYFINFSAILMSHTNHEKLLCLENAAVAKQFYEFYATHHVVEHYVLSDKGDFLLLDKEGNGYWLVFKSIQEIESLYQYASISEAPDTVLNALKNNDKIPVFYAAKDSDPEPRMWEPYLNKAYPIPHSFYYYTYKKQAINHDNILNNIQSYHDYLIEI